MSHSKTTAVLSKLSQGENICFKYSGGSWPGVPRNLFFHSWYVAGPVRGAYMTAYDSNGNFKTFHCSKISDFSSTSQSTSIKEEVSENNFSNWTSQIKQGDIIQFTYSDETEIRYVTFVEFMNRQCSPKTKILVYQNGYTKTFFINKMTIHNIVKNDGKTEIYQYDKEEYDEEESGEEEYDEEEYKEEEYDEEEYDEDDTNSDNEGITSTLTELHNEITNLTSKQELVISKMKAYFDSQNEIFEDLTKKSLHLQEKCYNLEDEVQQLYSIINKHKESYPSTVDSDLVSKQSSGWEVINSPEFH